MKVPFGTLNVNDKPLLDKVVASNWLTQGKTVALLEKEFAWWLDYRCWSMRCY